MCWVGGPVVLAVGFFFSALSFEDSTKASLYVVSVWLNACLVVMVLPRSNTVDKREATFMRRHDGITVWMISYFMTNLAWEVPWVLLSRSQFQDLATRADVVAQTEWMRSSPLHMYFWFLASFASVDLRTVNHDGTFFVLELYSFVNIAVVLLFFALNRRRSPHRYLVPVLNSGGPAIATFIFSFSEVFNGFKNMPGGLPDTMLALVWTQYQYFFFPLLFAGLALPMLRDDWRRADHANGL